MLGELKDMLSLCNSLSRYTSGSARLSFIISLEMAFRPKKDCPIPIKRTIYNNETGKKICAERNRETLFAMIQKHHIEEDGSTYYIFWINRIKALKGTRSAYIIANGFSGLYTTAGSAGKIEL
ncbi:MAG: hypothetical protein K6T66_01775 [Peptococcaceae bacterium]|nr:hypothetical protein [Peptococcaceae bacterium]